jgi:hypothetical protein
MRDPSEYQKRAEECLRKAEIASTAIDRADWLKFAEDWKELSRVPFQRFTGTAGREREPANTEEVGEPRTGAIGLPGFDK